MPMLRPSDQPQPKLIMWYYADNGVQNGPLTETDFNALIASGKITADTLVWRDGMATWLPLHQARPAQTTEPTTPVAPPIFSQANSGSQTTQAQILDRDYEHDFGSYLNQAWELVKSDFANFLLVTFLVGLCLIVANGIPYLSVITGILFTGPLTGGLVQFFLKKLRGQPATLNDGFSGFGPHFGQLICANFIPGLLAMLAFIPAAILAVIAIGIGSVAGKHGVTEGATFGLLIVAGVLAVAGLCVLFYLQACWMFTLWLVADKKLAFWPAMTLSRAVVRKHWWQTFFLGLIRDLIGLSGIILCGVGMLLTIPIAIAFQAYAYEKLFGDMQPAA